MATKQPNQSDLLLQYLQTARNAGCSWGEVEETVRQQFADADIAALLAQHGNAASLEALYVEMGSAAAEPRKMIDEHDFGIEMVSSEFGAEVFKYPSEQERVEGLTRLCNKVESLADSIQRSFYFVNVDSDYVPGSAWDQAETGDAAHVAEWSGSAWLFRFQGANHEQTHKAQLRPDSPSPGVDRKVISARLTPIQRDGGGYISTNILVTMDDRSEWRLSVAIEEFRGSNPFEDSIAFSKGPEAPFEEALADEPPEVRLAFDKLLLEAKEVLSRKVVSGPGSHLIKGTPDQVRDQVENALAYLRTVIDAPVEIRYGSGINIQVMPDSDDDRVVVTHADMGMTTVNYTSEGLILDVHAQDQYDEAVFTTSLESADLTVDTEGASPSFNM